MRRLAEDTGYTKDTICKRVAIIEAIAARQVRQTTRTNEYAWHGTRGIDAQVIACSLSTRSGVGAQSQRATLRLTHHRPLRPYPSLALTSPLTRAASTRPSSDPEPAPALRLLG